MIKKFLLIVFFASAQLNVAWAESPQISLLASTNCIENIESKPLLVHNVDQNSLKDSVYELISAAKSSILIITFSLDDKQTIDLINEKAAEGIDVWLLIDKAHMMGVTSKLHKNIRLGTRSFGEGHLHHKILVVDYSYIWLGSGNFTNHSFKSTKNLSIAFYSEDFGAYLHREASAIEGESARDGLLKSTIIDNQILELYILPHNQPGKEKLVEKEMNDRGKKRLIDLIDHAQFSIKASIDIWTHKELAQSFIRALQRGVDIQLVTRPEQDPYSVIGLIKNSGVPVKYKSGLHYKFMVVDDQILVNGSPNWSMNSFTRSDESFLILYPMSSEQKAIMQDLWSDQW